MKPYLMAAGAIVATLCAALLLPVHEPGTQRLHGSPPPAPAAPSATSSAPISSAAPLPSQLAPLPASFSGTEIDGRLRVDAQGHLILEQEIRHLFDYFLSSYGEESLQASIDRLQGYIRQTLAEPARGEALTLLNQYLDYKRQLVQLERDLPQLTSLDGIRQRERAVQALRARLFEPQAHQALFAEEEAYNQFTLDRLAIQQDSRLSTEQKGQALQVLREGLPEVLQQAVVPQLQAELHQQTAELRARGGSPAELRLLRQQLVGPEATERLEALDLKRADWQSRLTAYQQAREALQANQGLSEPERQAELLRLAETQFDSRERQRLEAALALQDSRKAHSPQNN